MIKLNFCKDKVELLTAYEDKEVICLGLDELFYEAYEELDLYNKEVEIISLEQFELKTEVQIRNRKIAITTLDNLARIIDKTAVVIVTTSLTDFLENEKRINDVLGNIDIETFLYYAVRNALDLTERSIERQKKIMRRKNNLKSTEARKISEGLIQSDKIIIPKLNVLVEQP